MPGVRKRLGSLVGPEGRRPTLVTGTTEQVAPGVPASVELVRTSDTTYRVDAKIPKGVDGDPAAVADLDNSTASNINTIGTASREAVKGAASEETASRLALPVNAVAPKRASMAGMFSLLAATPDENMIIQTQANALDTCARVTLADGTRAWRLHKYGGGTSIYSWTPAEPIDVPPSQGFLLDVDISDAAMFPDSSKYMSVKIFTDAALTEEGAIHLVVGGGTPNIYHGMKWSGAPLKTGRNTIRCAADYQTSVPATWGVKVYKVQFIISPQTTVTLDVRGLMLEAPKKARAIVIADRGYKDFYDYAYPKLQAAGIPVTWAVDPGLFGTGDGEYRAMTEAELHAAMASGNGDSCSFHAWQGQVTATLTPEQLVEDTARCIKWLQRHGYEGRMWRAAFTQGRADSWSAISDMVIGARNGDNRLGVARLVGQWPPIGWMHMPALQLDNTVTATQAAMDSRIALMKKTHGMFLPFFHSIGPGGFNITAAMFDYWLAEMKKGIAEGWVEFGTFESFFAEIGGSFTTANGRPVATWAEPNGAVKTKPLM